METEIDFHAPRDIHYWVYGLLVELADADPRLDTLEVFSMYWRPEDPPASPQEWRFMGNLGIGGKFYSTRQKWWVNCYPEDRTVERAHIICRVNAQLERMRLVFLSGAWS